MAKDFRRLILETTSPPAPPRKMKQPAAIDLFNQLNTSTSWRAPGSSIPARARPTVNRGRITVPARGTGRTFMFNPNDVSDTKAISWGTIEVPGASHPVYQFGAGGERLVSFELYLDGDRGRFGRQQSRVTEDQTDPTTGKRVAVAVGGRSTSGLSVMDEMHWYRSLEYPAAYGLGFGEVSPFICLFTFGELYNNMPCIVKKADWKINYWTPKLAPVRATVSIQLAEIVRRSQTATDILSQAGHTVYEL